MAFVKATRRRSFAKLCFAGPAGGGKSFTALRGAFALVRRGIASRIAVIQSEGPGKIEKYAGYTSLTVRPGNSTCANSRHFRRPHTSRRSAKRAAPATIASSLTRFRTSGKARAARNESGTAEVLS